MLRKSIEINPIQEDIPESNMPNELITEQVIDQPTLETVVEAKQEAPAIDVTKILETVTASLTETFKANLAAVESKYQTVVDSLQTQVGSLSTQLASQQEVTQAFSNSIKERERHAFYKGLAEEGVPPVLIQKFSMIESALTTKQDTIKLSTSAGEKEVDTISAIAALLTEAVNTDPVLTQQFGQSMSVPAVNAMQADMARIIEENKKLAEKKSVR